MISVLDGEIFDVAVDLRKNSNHSETMYADTQFKKRNLLWVPKGFAHGFYVKSKTALVSYKVTDYYNKMPKEPYYGMIRGGIKWPISKNCFK